MPRVVPLLTALLVFGCSPKGQPLARPSVGSHGLTANTGAWAVSLVAPGGGMLPTYHRGGEAWVEGVLGQRYAVRVDNRSGQRAEVVVTVDGRDVIDGEPGRLDARGYIIEPYGHVIIDGFRTSMQGVAAFRFTTPGDSYAGRRGGGANIGVIGVAVFEEQARPVVARPPARPWWRSEGGDEAEAKAAPAGEATADGYDMDYEPQQRSRGLGTQYGEHRYSPVSEVEFRRASDEPSAVLAVYYDDREGLVRRGVVPGPTPWYREQPHPFPADSDRRFAPPPN